MPDSAALPCLALAGPTASGKTAAALALAERHRIEIISVDSALVYRGMDVGTAKPSAAELAQVPHHLIDIRDPLQAYSAAEFVRDVQALLPDIRARGAQPVLVGGTMLYFKALMEGLDPMPAAQPALRAALEAEAAERGWPALHAELSQVDPDTAARLAPHDAQRIQRALEVYRATGQTLSHFHAGRAGRAEPGLPLVLLSLEPAQRSWLHERIGRRFHEMLAQGLIDEVQRLRARGDLHADLPSMRCVGYRQAWEALAGTLPMAELADRGIFATRQLAKRQLTWLRSMPQRRVIAADAPDALNQVLAQAESVLASPPGQPS
ncbi:tRNA (adenosine(37)-N6)-dimethylallyltransferase MiaA [Curvibacter sp. HBC61]|uniref:tRNA dimethylallyltransferase n=1 Tax=Curvibacter cyanobacteriorum TaxID=3026422 RepID=A0ABT5MUF7_9BURK|nr:tRNA (adenosine(37)-N6)-dimethylallyltransferase MiaA [Curvibacter sp. HBC61]MDD0836946.1 tRNA (adenosine(37)-N6)-dimethylallyltransferase MiaA [Curvibacter sp. HBC61]